MGLILPPLPLGVGENPTLPQAWWAWLHPAPQKCVDGRDEVRASCVWVGPAQGWGQRSQKSPPDTTLSNLGSLHSPSLLLGL